MKNNKMETELKSLPFDVLHSTQTAHMYFLMFCHRIKIVYKLFMDKWMLGVFFMKSQLKIRCGFPGCMMYDVVIVRSFSLSLQSANPVEETFATQLSTCYVTCWHYMQSSTQAVYARLCMNSLMHLFIANCASVWFRSSTARHISNILLGRIC